MVELASNANNNVSKTSRMTGISSKQSNASKHSYAQQTINNTTNIIDTASISWHNSHKNNSKSDSNSMNADDLLRTRSIPELRELVHSLDKEAISKQSELQYMVGSRYHDFIQSADAISMMQENSEEIGRLVSSFWNHSNDVIEKSKNLLTLTASTAVAHMHHTTSTAVDTYTNDRVKVNSIYAWDCLHNSDIYNASKVFMIAALILQPDNVPIKSNLIDENDQLVLYNWIHSCLSSNSKIYYEYNSLMFLYDTIVNDAKTLVLIGSTPSSICKAVASLGILGNMNKVQLLQLYLEYVNVMMNHELNDSSASNDNTSMRIESITMILQYAILDIHYTFFRNSTGEIKHCQEKLVNDVEGYLNYIRINNNLGKQRINCNRNNDTADDHETLLSSRGIFDTWLANIIQQVTQFCDVGLATMKSATDVARLQQRIWNRSTKIQEYEPADSSRENDEYQNYTQNDWECACIDLLAPKQVRRSAFVDVDKVLSTSSSSTGSTSSDRIRSASTLLWSAAFRVSFVTQVERLLKDSCDKILFNTKQILLQCLLSEGIDVDSNTLSVSIKYSPAGESSSSSSCRLFNLSDRVRSFLEAEVTDLMHDIILPVQQGDPQCAALLSRALLIQCSQLAGQLATLLRVLATSFNAMIDQSYKASSSSSSGSKKIDMKTSVKSLSEDGLLDKSNVALMSGLLLIGRLAWLMKIRGDFFEDALNSKIIPTSSRSNSSSSSSNSILSEEQLRSAFEIADIDGDGVVSYSEAVEAMQALDHSHVENSDSSNTSFLSQATSPSLSYHEFALLCTHLMSPGICHPGLCLGRCIDDIIAFSHTSWIDKTVRHFGSIFVNAVYEEYRLSYIQSKIKSGDGGSDDASDTKIKLTSVESNVSLPFKQSWRKEVVDIGGDVDEGEVLYIPTTASASLTAFISSVHQRITHSTLSIDTVQELIPVQLTGNKDCSSSSSDVGSKVVIDRLAQYTAEQGVVKVLKVVSETFATMLREATSCNSSISSSSTWHEDFALQATFDLNACELMACRCNTTGIDTRSSSIVVPKMLKIATAGWRSKLDPISAELITPLLSASVANFYSKTFLIFPGFTSPLTTGASDGSSSSSSSNNSINTSSASSIFSNTCQGKFALLPLPFASSNSSNTTSSNSSSNTATPGVSSGTYSAAAGSSSKQSKSNNTFWGMKL